MAKFPNSEDGRGGAISAADRDRATRARRCSFSMEAGSRIGYRDPALRRWSIQLNGLDEGELADVIAFVEQQCLAPFSFTDPVTGQTASRCIIARPEDGRGMKQEENGQATLIIEEIP